MRRNPLLMVLILVFPSVLIAGNIQVSNVNLTNQNPTFNSYQVEFDLSWENSWRTNTLESNWDAAWVVIKFKEVSETDWQHGNVSNLGSTFPAGVTGDAAGTTGFFIYRDAAGIGPFSAEGISIRWNYAGYPDDAVFEVCVFAIELVYIPEGAFQVGDGSVNAAGQLRGGSINAPYTISSEAEITLGGSSAQNLTAVASGMFFIDDFDSATTQTLWATFPKGFQAFYIMKYEASEQQYVDFLNHITVAGAANRYTPSIGNEISDTGISPEIYVSAAPDRACNNLGWNHQAAYADWIGLRPMSELEYEKASRGPRPAVAAENAWGNSFLSNQNFALLNPNEANESIPDLPQNTGNACYMDNSVFNGQRPYRAGIFAFSSVNGTRQETGASYYGVMELSGNLFELVVCVGSSQGRAFRGSHGNGVLGSSGNHTNFLWPNATTALGTGHRGGNFGSSGGSLSVSSRSWANFAVDNQDAGSGVRLVRTAP